MAFSFKYKRDSSEGGGACITNNLGLFHSEGGSRAIPHDIVRDFSWQLHSEIIPDGGWVYGEPYGVLRINPRSAVTTYFLFLAPRSFSFLDTSLQKFSTPTFSFLTLPPPNSRTSEQVFFLTHATVTCHCVDHGDGQERNDRGIDVPAQSLLNEDCPRKHVHLWEVSKRADQDPGAQTGTQICLQLRPAPCGHHSKVPSFVHSSILSGPQKSIPSRACIPEEMILRIISP